MPSGFAHFDNAMKTAAGVFQDSFERLAARPGLVRNAAFDEFSGRICWDLAGNVDLSVCTDCLGLIAGLARVGCSEFRGHDVMWAERSNVHKDQRLHVRSAKTFERKKYICDLRGAAFWLESISILLILRAWVNPSGILGEYLVFRSVMSLRIALRRICWLDLARAR